jgi:hypothetical protein
MPINLYANRKHLGPLDLAQINSIKSKHQLIKLATLQSIINELQDIEAQLNIENLPKSDDIMLRLLKSQLNNQLFDFLGVPYDDKAPEDS